MCVNATVTVMCAVWLYVMFDCVMCDCDIWLINSAQMTWNFLFWQFSCVWHSCVMHHWCVTALEGVREAMDVTTHSHSAVSYAKAQNGVQVNWLESTGISGIQLVRPEYVGECKLLFTFNQLDWRWSVLQRHGWCSVGEVQFQTDANSVWTGPNQFQMVRFGKILAQTKWFGFRFGGSGPIPDHLKPIRIIPLFLGFLTNQILSKTVKKWLRYDQNCVLDGFVTKFK
jgi:hypothetical protein